MTDREQFAARLVEASAVAIAATESSSDGFDGTWGPAGQASAVALLRELAETYWNLADIIEKGTGNE